MSRSSYALWKVAFDNVPGGVPSCPLNLSFPSWAHLLYDRFCDVSASCVIVRIGFIRRRDRLVVFRCGGCSGAVVVANPPLRLLRKRCVCHPT